MNPVAVPLSVDYQCVGVTGRQTFPVVRVFRGYPHPNAVAFVEPDIINPVNKLRSHVVVVAVVFPVVGEFDPEVIVGTELFPVQGRALPLGQLPCVAAFVTVGWGIMLPLKIPLPQSTVVRVPLNMAGGSNPTPSL